MKSLKFIILIFSFAAISAAVSGCSLKFWQKPINPPVTKNEGDATATSTEEIDVSDWLTYRNEEYGFEVRYPREWIVDQKKNFVCLTRKIENVDVEKITRPCHVSVNIYSSLENLAEELGVDENETFFSLEEWLNYKIKNYIFADKKIVNIDNNKGFFVATGSYTEGVNDKFLFIEHNSFIYELTILDQGIETSKESLSVVKSIKFIKFF